MQQNLFIGVPVKTLEEFYTQAYLPQHIMVEDRPGTARQKIGSFDKYILPMFGKKELDKFRQMDWVTFRNSLKLRGLSPKTIKNHQGYLRHLFNLAVEWEEIENFPILKSVKVELPDIVCLRGEEIINLVRAAGQEPDRYRLLFMLALKTGMRIGELRGLQWADFQERDGRKGVLIQRSVPGRQNDVGPTKNGKSRFLLLSEPFIEDLHSLGQTSQFVFSSPETPFMPLTYKAADCAIKRMLRRAGMGSLGWHAIRHSVATYLIGKSVPLVTVRDLLGHVDIRTTMRYVHLDASSLLPAFAALDCF